MTAQTVVWRSSRGSITSNNGSPVLTAAPRVAENSPLQRAAHSVLRTVKRCGGAAFQRAHAANHRQSALFSEKTPNAFGTGSALGFAGIGHAAQLDGHRQAGQWHSGLRKLRQLHPGQGAGLIEELPPESSTVSAAPACNRAASERNCGHRCGNRYRCTAASKSQCRSSTTSASQAC